MMRRVPSPPRLPVDADDVLAAGEAAEFGVPLIAAVEAEPGVPPIAAVEAADDALLPEVVLVLVAELVLALLPQAASSAVMAGAASPNAAPRFSTSRRLIRCSDAARRSCSMRDS